MEPERFVYFVHGTDYNNEPEDSNLMVGYFTSLVLVKTAVEEYVKEIYEVEPESLVWTNQFGKILNPRYLILTATDDEKEGNFNIYIEAVPLDKRL
jgi:hypothetical protein